MSMGKEIRNPYIWLIVAGIVMRVGGALLFSCNYSGDHAIPCMMSKHIIEGNPIPVFYYGQPYMGSLEPLVSALLYRLPFSPNFNCNLGTALFGILLLPLIAWWGCRVGGRSAGIIALAVSVIGPPVYMQFMNWSYGGYAAATFFVVATTLCGLRLIELERERRGSAPLWLWTLCGISAGLGWWTNPLILVSLGTLFLLGVFVLRGGCFQWKLIPALVCFFLFGLPFWIWDLTHHWGAVRFILADTANDLPGGLRRFAFGLTFAVMNLDHSLGVALFLLFLLLCFFISVKTWRGCRKEAVGLYLGAAWLVLVCTLLLFLRKPMRIGPSRYFLPILPVVAVLFGYSMAELNRRLPYRLGWLLLLLVLGLQARFIPTPVRWYADRHAYYEELESLRPYFDALDSDVIFADYAGDRKYGHGLNLYYQEAYCFTDVPEFERCPHYVLKGERAEQVGVLNNKNAMASTMRTAGYTARTTILPNSLPLVDRFVPPPAEACVLMDGFVIRDVALDADLTEVLSDGNSRTGWRNMRGMTNQEIEVRFQAPQSVRKIRLLCERGKWPEGVTVLVQYPGRDDWEQAGSRHMMIDWYWPDAARRPYAGGAYYRQEVFTDLTNAAAVRIILNDNLAHSDLELSELQMFTGDDRVLNEPGQVEVLLQALKSNGVERVYCDRWTANLLHNRCGETMDWRLSLEPHIFKEDALCLSPQMTLDEACCLVVRPENAALCRQICRVAGVSFREQPVDRWILFLVDPLPGVADASVLVWRGFGPQWSITDDAAETLCREAERALERGDEQEAETLIRLVRAAWPDYLPVHRLDLALMNRQGRGGDEGSEAARRIARLEGPEQALSVRYRNGVELEGVTLSDRTLSAGAEWVLRYYWRIPETLVRHGCAVFCHLKNEKGETVFRDDRVLLDDYRGVAHPLPERFIETRTMRLPDSLPPGVYSLHVGLYQSNPPHERFKPKTALPVFNRAIRLPVEVTVGRAEK
ncbi:MAG: hypothetical protein PHP44_04580 [Kiritimatiellae bacterium]|nr:hypothetical protein [Kiritimatiellia bacterium]